jgi:hypothetical protein
LFNVALLITFSHYEGASGFSEVDECAEIAAEIEIQNRPE